MTSPTFTKFVCGGCKKPDFGKISDENTETVFVVQNPKSGDSFESVYGGDNVYVFELVSNADSLSQCLVDLKIDEESYVSLSVQGTNGTMITVKRKLKNKEGSHKLSITFPPAIEIKKLSIKK